MGAKRSGVARPCRRERRHVCHGGEPNEKRNAHLMADGTVIAAIVVAAGTGERAGGEPKQYRGLAGVPVLARAIQSMLAVEAVGWVLPVIHADHAERYRSLNLADARLLPAVPGGAHRQASVLAGLRALTGRNPDLVLIHDAARPLVGAEIVTGVIDALVDHDGALPASPVTDTIKRSSDGTRIIATEDRLTLFAAQTPQGFRYRAILDAHERAAKETDTFTDDASIAEWAGLSVVLTKGSSANLKLTLPEDFGRAERLIAGGTMETRIGTGFDVHAFGPGTFVTLGGVEIAHTHGLVGHSDADAVLHAIADALYGALGAGDIGTHFPPGDERWRGAASRIFLAHAAGLVGAGHGRIVNIDATVVCEAPRITPHVGAMRVAIAAACGISEGRVAIKATTSEGMGFTGRREGIAAMATASIEVPRDRAP